MPVWLILLIILLILLGCLAARSAYEVTHPEVRHFAVRTDKLSGNDKVRIAFLADLHSRTYGKDNIRLIRMVSKARPDFIILRGDMMTASSLTNRDDKAVAALEGLGNIAPVFYVPGNHEKKMMESDDEQLSERWEDYLFEMECMDLNWLADRSEIMTEDMYIYGLDIDQQYYTKFGKAPAMPLSYIKRKLGRPDQRKFNILVAHSPEFFDTYIRSDYDLILCGHYHGGMVNLPWIGPLIAPNFTFRPEHAGGAYRKNGKVVIVSRGIGSHGINIRLFNRPEIVVIDVKHEENRKDPKRSGERSSDSEDSAEVL